MTGVGFVAALSVYMPISLVAPIYDLGCGLVRYIGFILYVTIIWP